MAKNPQNQAENPQTHGDLGRDKKRRFEQNTPFGNG